jgi:ankyrin repeat protein
MKATADFFAAVQTGDAGRVQALLEADPSLSSAKNDRGQSALLLSVYYGHNKIRDLLLAKGLDLELHEAAATGHVGRVKLLVEKYPSHAQSFSPDGFPLIALAAFMGHLEVVEYLFSRGADLNAVASNGTGYNAMTASVTSGHAKIVSWLLEHGGNPNYVYGPGYTPLLAAAANGHLEIVKMLLEHGADLQAKANDGKTALTLAEERGHEAIARFLRAR